MEAYEYTNIIEQTLMLYNCLKFRLFGHGLKLLSFRARIILQLSGLPPVLTTHVLVHPLKYSLFSAMMALIGTVNY